MKSFNKAAIAAVTAAAVTTSLCIPASAEETTIAGVKVENDVCTITLNADEATLLGLEARQEVKLTLLRRKSATAKPTSTDSTPRPRTRSRSLPLA